MKATENLLRAIYAMLGAIFFALIPPTHEVLDVILLICSLSLVLFSLMWFSYKGGKDV